MPRNAFWDFRREAGRLAQRATLDTNARAKPATSAAAGQKAGTTDPVTGRLLTYGRLGWTPLGTGFRLAGE